MSDVRELSQHWACVVYLLAGKLGEGYYIGETILLEALDILKTNDKRVCMWLTAEEVARLAA